MKKLLCLLTLPPLLHAACAGDPEIDVNETSQAVAMNAKGRYYDLAVGEPGALGWARLASGTIAMPITDSNGVVQTVSTKNGPVSLRGTCGVTFISPSYAVTAAHCVDSPPELPVQVTMYRLDNSDPAALEAEINNAAALKGTFPDFTHPRMGPLYSNNIDTYTCWIVSRCYSSTKSFQCPVQGDSDVGMIHCPGTPGSKYGYVDVAEIDKPDVPVTMLWSHEIYAIDQSNTSVVDHYVTLANGKADNYHYFGKSTSGVESNQLLPVKSIVWPNNTPPRKYGTNLTDLAGCQGTSGSGVFQESDRHTFELSGTASGVRRMGLLLCDDPGNVGAGLVEISYASQAVLLTLAQTPEVMEDRNIGNPAPLQPPLLWLRGEREHLSNWSGLSSSAFVPRPLSWMTGCAECSAIEKQKPWDDLAVSLSPGEVLFFPATVVAGGHYRMSVQGYSTNGAVTVDVWGGGKRLMTDAQAPGGNSFTGTIATAFTAESSATWAAFQSKALDYAFMLTDVAIVSEDAPNGFEDMFARAGVGVVPAFDSSTPVKPAAFVGNGTGVAALLRGGERLVFTRQALMAGKTWSLQFKAIKAGTGPAPALSCGFIQQDGTATQQSCTPDKNGVVNVSPLATAGRQPIALFIQLPTGASSVKIDDLLLRITGNQ